MYTYILIARLLAASLTHQMYIGNLLQAVSSALSFTTQPVGLKSLVTEVIV